MSYFRHGNRPPRKNRAGYLALQDIELVHEDSLSTDGVQLIEADLPGRPRRLDTVFGPKPATTPAPKRNPRQGRSTPWDGTMPEFAHWGDPAGARHYGVCL